MSNLEHIQCQNANPHQQEHKQQEHPDQQHLISSVGEINSMNNLNTLSNYNCNNSEQVPEEQSLIKICKKDSNQQKKVDDYNLSMVKKIYQENLEKQRIEQEETERQWKLKKLAKKNKQANKPKNVQTDPAQIKKQRRERILQGLQTYIKKYLKSRPINLTQSEVASMRQKNQQKIFKFLLYGIVEIKQLQQSTISEQLQPIRNLSNVDTYDYTKNLTVLIDYTLYSVLNNRNNITATKPFKTRYKQLCANIEDDENFELRKKILCKIWDAKTLATIDQQSLYSQKKKQILQNKKRILLNQAQAEVKPIRQQQEQMINYDMQEGRRNSQAPSQNNNSNSNSKNDKNNRRKQLSRVYCDYSILEYLNQHLINKNTIENNSGNSKCPNNLKKNLDLLLEVSGTQNKKKLIENLESVFKL